MPAVYQTVLNRSIDTAGAQFWDQILQSGTLTHQAVATAILTSAEAEQRQVETLYQTFLGRSADAGGLKAFTDALRHGWSVETVEAAILGSPEYLQRL